MSVSLVSLNIERSMHLERVIPFLTNAHSQVTCIQELYERDIPALEKAAGHLVAFAPMSQLALAGDPLIGIGIFSRIPFRSHEIHYYRGTPHTIPHFNETSVATKYATENAMVLSCNFEYEGFEFCIGTTHFTWTPDGLPSGFQRNDLAKLLQVLSILGEWVLCGDFNAPRGGEIFSALAERYTDNIPHDILWSIDRDLHRAGREKLETEISRLGLPGLLVDGLFSTPSYRASHVAMICGVSDHCALRADIERAGI